jgi:cytochrome P450
MKLPRLGQRRLPPRLLFSYAGSSGGWPGMGQQLYRRYAPFRESIEASSATVERMLGWSPAPHFRGPAAPETDPMLARRNMIIHLGMLQVAHTDLWRHFGVLPAAVVSVSLGEMTAPYAAGALSRDDSMRLVTGVALSVSRAASPERMFVLNRPPAEALRLARTAPVSLTYLGSRGPASTALLGHDADSAAARAHLGDAVEREIPTPWIYHTPPLDIGRDWLPQAWADVVTMPARCPMYSSSAGGLLPAGAPLDYDFFAWMASRPFHFDEALSAALADGYDAILNIGALPAIHLPLGQNPRVQTHGMRVIDAAEPHDELGAWSRARAAVRALRGTPPRARTFAAETLNFFAFDHALDPFAAYETLRRDGSVHYLPRHQAWFLLGYDDVQYALLHPQQFSSRTRALRNVDPHLAGNDPPEHTAVRRLMARHFSPEANARRTDLVRTEAERLLQPLRAGRELDAVRDFGDPLGDILGGDLAGFPAADVEAFVEPTLASEGNTGKFFEQLKTLLDDAIPRSRIYADLRGDGFDDDTARSLIRQLWHAATVEVKRAVPMSILLLLRHAEARARVSAEPQLLPAFADESIRLWPPEHFVPRTTTADVQIDGRTIPAGALVQLSLAAANRDPARFAEPEALRLDRMPNPHLSFGAGAHRCIGAALARAHIAAAIGALLAVAPHFRAIQPLATLRFARGAPYKQLQELVIGNAP